MRLVLLILGIVFLMLGIVALVATGFLGFVVYIPFFVLGVICLFLRNRYTKG